MRPDNNPKLFEQFGRPQINSLNEEFLRRNLVAGVLEDLSNEFEEKDHTAHPVAEPTLVARLFALSQVQRTAMGIAGFDPLETVDFSRYRGSIEAKAAPAHDSFDDNGSTYKTRAIKFVMHGDDAADAIDVFGLNFYQEDAAVDEIAPAEASAGLVLIGDKGNVVDKQKPITGSTLLFAVRSKMTNDAKVYTVDVVDPGKIDPAETARQTVQESKTSTKVVMPDQTVIRVTQLEGNELAEAVNELQSSYDRLKQQNSPDDDLDETERAAISTLIRADGEWGTSLDNGSSLAKR